jgi:uncharacterized protein (TIGR03435 family)
MAMSSLHLVFDHLWQSTLFAAVVAVVVAMLRGKRASVRHALWLAASIKFVIPFAALTAFGAVIGSRLSLHVPQPAPDFVQTMTSAPFVPQIAPALSIAPSSTATAPSSVLLPALIAIWSAGCLIVLAAWTVRWMRAYRAVRMATPYDTGREATILRRIEASGGHKGRPYAGDHRRGGPCGRPKPLAMRVSDATIEPGVFGVWRPLLLWPRAMSAHLSDDQIETILVHELSHVQRRDNLTALAHGLVQAICWFHPLVWWIGARLIDERERACDEAVVRAGRDRQVYAESLLKTCQFCIDAPVTCMAGVTGSDLKRRVASIMAAPVGGHLGIVARLAFVLVIAAIVAVPVINGAARVPQMSSTISLPDPSKTFDAASVRQNKSGEQGGGSSSGSGRLTTRNSSLKSLLLQAFPIQNVQLVGGPGWLDSDRFDVVAKAAGKTPDADLRVMLQNLLVERFSIKMHIETRNLPVYALALAREDGRLGPDLHPGTTGRHPGEIAYSSNGSFAAGEPTVMRGVTMAALARALSAKLGRPVVDRTGLDGRFELELRYTMPRDPVTTASDPAGGAPELFTALQEQLGLKLEATRGPVEVLVIDSAEHPKNDDFEMPAQ